MKTDTQGQIVVAPGRRSDAPALAQLHSACFASGWDEQSMRQFVGESACTVLVARHSDAAVPRGFLICRVAGGEAEVLSLAVAADARGQGIGEALWQTACQDLLSRNVSRIVLEVGANNAAAHALYRKLGFREVGRRNGYYQGANGEPPQDGLIMACDLATSGGP